MLGHLKVKISPDAVHGAWLEVDQDCPGHILGASSLIVVHVDPLQLEVRGACVRSGGVDAVLVADNLPELHRLGLYWKCRGREIQGYEKADLLVYWTVSM